MKNNSKILLTSALLLLLAAGGWWWWKSSGEASGAGGPQAASAPASGASGAGGPGGGGGRRFGGGNQIQPVSVMPVRRQDIRVTVNAIGSITASNTAVVRPQVSGVLQSLNFKEGQQVRAGQQLAQIDPRSFQAALSQAEAGQARDRAQLEGAKVDLARYKDLMAKDAIPRQQLDTQATLVAQLEGTAKVDQAQVDSAKLQLSYTRVLAPISGRVGLKQADLGNVVQPGDANGIVVITQTRPIALVFSVPAAHVPLITTRLRANETIPVEAWDRGGKRQLATGTLATVDNAIDAATDTIKVKAIFPNADDALFPNQAVSVVLQLDTVSDALAVPQSAVLRGAQGFYVYVVNADNTVATRVVKPGAVDGNLMAVEGQLEAGERVVIDGVDRLREGGKVEVIAADPSKRAGATGGGKRRGNRGGAPGAAASGASAPAATAPASAPREGRRASQAAAATATVPAEESDEARAEARRKRIAALPPEVREKLKNMSPEERRAWFQEHRDQLPK